MNLNTKHAGKLFILSGPSGAGKGTICKELLAQTDLQLSVSMTTRAPREGEIHGVHYYFVDEEEFAGQNKQRRFSGNMPKFTAGATERRKNRSSKSLSKALMSYWKLTSRALLR